MKQSLPKCSHHLVTTPDCMFSKANHSSRRNSELFDRFTGSCPPVLCGHRRERSYKGVVQVDKLEGMAMYTSVQPWLSWATLAVPLPLAWHMFLGLAGSSPSCGATARSDSLHWHTGDLLLITEATAHWCC